MKKKKNLFEEEENIDEDLDVYDEEGLDISVENDGLSDEEAAFMNGYMCGNTSEEENEENL